MGKLVAEFADIGHCCIFFFCRHIGVGKQSLPVTIVTIYLIVQIVRRIKRQDI
jgi:hypothetical protein